MRARFTAPLPGLAGTEYELQRSEDAPGLYSLQSAADSRVRLHLLDAGMMHAYAPSLPAEDLVRLRLDTAPLVLLIASIHDGVLTLNLMAPILVNTVSGACTQVILDGNFPLRAVFSDY